LKYSSGFKKKKKKKIIYDNKFMLVYDILMENFVSQVLNPTEFFEGIVVEHEYVECTASTVQALVLFKKLYPGHRKKEVENCITNAVRYIESIQMFDGSW
jgi:squalene cyclase